MANCRVEYWETSVVAGTIEDLSYLPLLGAQHSERSGQNILDSSPSPL